MRYKKLLSFIVVGLVLGFIFINIFKNIDVLTSVQWDFGGGHLLWIILALLPVYFVNTLSWHLITRSLGLKLSFSQNLRIWVLSNASRFIPGSIWQYAGRVYLSSQRGVPMTMATTALFIEMIFSVLIGTMIILLTLPLIHLSIKYDLFWLGILITLFLVLVILIFSSDKILSKISLVLKRLSFFKGEIKYSKFQRKFIPLILISFLMQFLVDSLVLYLMVGLVVDLKVGDYLVILGVFSLSWLLGYLAFFSPSGLGVQELSIASLLSPMLSFPVASVVAILFRFGLLCSELMVVIVVLVQKRLTANLADLDEPFRK